MDLRFQPLAIDSERDVTVFLFAGSDTYTEIRGESATPLIDLSPFATRVAQIGEDITISLAWHTELDGANMPRPGQRLAVYLGSTVFLIKTIAAMRDYRRSTGSQSATFVARGRDGTPAWRDIPRSTVAYPVGTQTSLIAYDVAERALGLESSEIQIGSTGGVTERSSTQLANLPGWKMLEEILLPSGKAPFVDGIGRLRTVSRDILGAPPSTTIADERFLEMRGARSEAPITQLVVKWRDPKLHMVKHQDTALGSANMTAGFFQPIQDETVWFSEDHTQRALDLRVVVKQSANSGLLPFAIGEGNFVAILTPGEQGAVGASLQIRTQGYTYAMVGLWLAAKLTNALIPEPVESAGVGVSVGLTTPAVGRYVEALLDVTMLLLISSIGTGVYEVWGTPFSWVTRENRTEVADPTAPLGSESATTIDTDFIVNEQQAQAYASREFVYRVREANTFTVRIVDDPRLERGDLIVVGGMRFKITSISRDLTHGAPAEATLTGFPA